MGTKFNKEKIGVERSFTQLFLLLVLIVICMFLSIKSKYFLTFTNIRNILDHTSLQLIMALSMTFVITAKGIDLSIGSMVALTGIVIGITYKLGVPIFISSILGLIAGGLMGFLNGIIISKLKIAPYVVTIGSMSLFRGLTLIITKGQPIYGFPKEFTYLGKGNYGEINPPIMIAFILIIVMSFVLKKTKWGQYAITLGSNEESLRRVGVNVDFYKTSIYVLSGLTAALSGLILTSRLNVAEPNAGFMLESDIVASVILGGTNMKGGKTSISGTVIACLLLSVIKNGLTLLSISSYYQQLIVGFIILFSVSVSEIRQRRQIQIN